MRNERHDITCVSWLTRLSFYFSGTKRPARSAGKSTRQPDCAILTRLSDSDLTGRAVFPRGNATLEVLTTNKRPLELLLGVCYSLISKQKKRPFGPNGRHR